MNDTMTLEQPETATTDQAASEDSPFASEPTADTGQAGAADALEILADPQPATEQEAEMANGTSAATRTRRTAGAVVGAGRKRLRRASTRPARARSAKKMSKAPDATRVRKAYRLVDGIPDEMKKASAGRAILEAIKKHGTATSDVLLETLGKKFSKPTMRFYLGKFQREKIIRAK